MTKDTKIAKKSAKTEVAKVDKKAAPVKVDKKAEKKAPAKKVESSSEEESSEEESEESEEESSEEEEKEEKAESSSEESEESEEEKMIDHKRKREEESSEAPNAKQAKSDDTNVFVGGLPFSATEDSIRAFFSSCGTISEVRIIMDRQTGRSKGFGYVDFTTSEGAQEALKLHESEFEGRQIRLDLAGSKPAPGNNHAGPSEKPPSKTVFIGGLSFNTTVEGLTEAFGECGDLKECRVAKDQDGNSRGFGYAEFHSVEAASKAIEFNETEFEGRQIRVNYAEEKQGGDRGGRGGFGGGRGRF